MPKIIIQNLNNREIFIEGAHKTLLDIIRENDLDWMQACGAKGRCSTCKKQIIGGLTYLSPITKGEAKFLNQKRLGNNKRLSCQTYLRGDLVIRVADENKFFHLAYSE